MITINELDRVEILTLQAGIVPKKVGKRYIK
jgi:hypothetical protein